MRFLHLLLSFVSIWFTGMLAIFQLFRNKSESVPEPAKETQNIFIWTQIRSGSRFTGWAINMDPETFYLEEPVAELIEGGDISSNISRFLEDIGNCEFKKYPLFMDNRSMHPLDKRWGAVLRDTPYLRNSMDFDESVCRSSRSRLMKVVIPRMEIMKDALNRKNSRVKIIHLVRDPRAILNSKKNLKSYLTLQKVYEKEHPCDKQESDLRFEEAMKSRGNKRILRVYYEQMMKSPASAFREIYQWLEIPFTRRVMDQIVLKTQVDASPLFPFHLQRRSSQRVEKWRYQMDFPEVEEIQNRCRNVLQLAGYRIFQNKYELRNSSIISLLS